MIIWVDNAIIKQRFVDLIIVYQGFRELVRLDKLILF